MLGFILRIVAALLAMAGLALLFAYFFIAALIVTPFLLLFLYLMRRRINAQFEILRREEQMRQGPVIDHDPNDLP